MGQKEFVLLWAAAFVAALTGFLARIMYIFGTVEPNPPVDPLMLALWTRRRRWLFAAELAALPMFSTLAILMTAEGWLTPIPAVMFALAAGALGFAFFKNALEALVKLRLGINKGFGK